jgi:hypothetical protein
MLPFQETIAHTLGRRLLQLKEVLTQVKRAVSHYSLSPQTTDKMKSAHFEYGDPWGASNLP